jgi:hypothetical protein
MFVPCFSTTMEAISSTRALSARIKDRRSFSLFMSKPVVAVVGRDCAHFARWSRDCSEVDCPPFDVITVRGVKLRRKGGLFVVPLTGPPSELRAETDLLLEPLKRSAKLSKTQIAPTNGAWVTLSSRILVRLMMSGAIKIRKGRSARGIRFYFCISLILPRIPEY